MPELPPAQEPVPRSAIALIGFMAAGKSRGATAIARVLGEQRADCDELLEAELGEPISSYFEREGEAAFREVEERVTLKALRGGGVVSLGGGALSSARVRAALGSCVTVLLPRQRGGRLGACPRVGPAAGRRPRCLHAAVRGARAPSTRRLPTSCCRAVATRRRPSPRPGSPP